MTRRRSARKWRLPLKARTWERIPERSSHSILPMDGLAGKITSSLHESNFACYNCINGITSTADEYNFPSYNCMYKQHNNMWEGRRGRLRRNSYGDARIVRGIRLDTARITSQTYWWFYAQINEKSHE